MAGKLDTIQEMLKLTFQPLMKWYSLKAIYLGPLYRARITGNGIDWKLTARRNGGFCIKDVQTNTVLVRENREDDGKQKWKEFSLSHYGGKRIGSEAMLIRKDVKLGDLWGESGEKMELHLLTKKRAFECEHFTIVHRDFWNKLEINYEGNIENAYLAAWWCLHYWCRRSG